MILAEHETEGTAYILTVQGGSDVRFIGDVYFFEFSMSDVTLSVETGTDIAGATIAAIADQTWTGSAITPIPPSPWAERS